MMEQEDPGSPSPCEHMRTTTTVRAVLMENHQKTSRMSLLEPGQ